MRSIVMLLSLVLLSTAAVPVDSHSSKLHYEKTKSPHTILWKIEGKNLTHPAYIIGTCHAVSKSFLDSFPAISKVLQQADCLLTEIYPSATTDSSSGFMDIKALPLLDKKQYALLDSFFKATAGPTEGLDNEDVKNISVRDFIGGIYEMLLRKRGDAPFDQMDRQLYEFFHADSKSTFALEKDSDLFFDKSDTAHAKLVLKKLIDQSVRHPDLWDLSDPNSELGKFVQTYKTLKFDYQFDKPEPAWSDSAFSKTISERNRKWIPEIESRIQQQQTVIAVGLYHLAFKTGLVNLLRADGYKVTPVAI